MANKNILLIEPGYKNKYPPLGLMKIAQYHGKRGKNDNIVFVKGSDSSVFDRTWDRIYVTTLFSFEWKKTAETIDYALKAANGISSKVFVGGIAASLMQDEFIAESRWAGIRFIKGLLETPPATSLRLDSFSEELYSDDLCSEPIEDLVPDYSILEQIDYQYHVHDAYFLYASRGCVRKCKFCGVPKLEGAQRDLSSIAGRVDAIRELYGDKKDLVLMDNNFTASPFFKEIIAEIRDLGFVPNATLLRNGRTYKRRVDFNQGVDARILCKDPMFLREIATICIRPLRIAFDNIGFRKVYEQSVRYAADAGIDYLSNYMLYNFRDTPDDLYLRMVFNVELREELGIDIYSFPMRYQPTDYKDRSYIGRHWNRHFLRSIQIILQATHGIASGAPSFFRRAFGCSNDEFRQLLYYPHHFLFNRAWYHEYNGRSELDEFLSKFGTITEPERAELLEFLCTHKKSQYSNNLESVKPAKLRSLLRHYVPLPQEEERKIWDFCKLQRKRRQDHVPPRDERVEDAGIEEAA